MSQLSFTRRIGVAIAVASGLILSGAPMFSPAHARDFFSVFFGGFNAPPEPSRSESSPFVGEFGQAAPQRKRVTIYGSGGGSSAYCVRTCDGRYFPISVTGGQSRAEACKSFCPASETRVVSGSSIDNAATEGGKPYSSLPNAFKFRTELVAGCTCNGKDSGGLAKVNIESDPTIRKGDLVAGANGLVVAKSSGSERRDGSVDYSPVSRSTQAQFQRLPVVAAE